LRPFTLHRYRSFLSQGRDQLMKRLRVGGAALIAALVVLGAPKHAFAQG
jgi:hypothetical protein